MGGDPGGVGVELAVDEGVIEGVNLNVGEGVIVPEGAAVEVSSKVDEGVIVPEGGVNSNVGKSVIVPDGALVRLAVGVAVSEAGEGVVDEGIRVSDGVGAELVSVSVRVGVRLSAGDVSDGMGVDETVDEGTVRLVVYAGVLSGTSAEEARGKERKNKSPASDRAPGGFNRGTLTPSS